MNTPKLPPLPEPIAFRTRPDATVKWWYGDSETKAPLCEIRERLFSAAQMNDHYIKGYNDGLAAHGVPDGLTLAAVGHKHFGNPLPQAWYAAAKELFASAPPAPQSWPFPGWEVKQAEKVAFCHAKDAEQLTLKNAQAAVVQQEPVAWLYTSPAGHKQAFTGDPQDRFKSNCVPLYTHPAQQAKPQPLSRAKIDDFKHWLNVRRSLTVSECFHEIVACYEAAACAERDARIAELARQLAEARQALEGWANYDKWLWPESALEQAKKNTVAALASMQKG